MKLYIYRLEDNAHVGTISRDLENASDQEHQDGQNEMLAEAESEYGSNDHHWSFTEKTID